MAAAKGTIVVTGANGGLGSAVVKQIVSKPELAAFHGLYAVRDAAVAPSLRAALAGNPSHAHDIFSQELTNLDSVRLTASAINTRIAAGEIPPIRVLILCAGCRDFGKQTRSENGLDTTFGGNYLGPRRSPYDKRNVSTKAFIDDKYKTIIHHETSVKEIAQGNWSWGSAQEDQSFQGGTRRYGAAKLFLIMFQHELQRRLDRDPALTKICILGVDPGTMLTGLPRHAPWFIRVLIFQIIFPIIAALMPNGPVRSTQLSASHVLGAAFDSTPDLGEYPRDRYLNGAESLETSAESRDVQKAEVVWKESVRLSQLKKDETVLVDWQ
ncbi:hypothetical protein JX266_004539 [Neoarthrinium moseri]|nr:hypothetical protein JX266_004539 [Neoarthrinium moseri]